MAAMQSRLPRRHRWGLGFAALLLLLVLLGLALRSRLPTLVPDLAIPHGKGVQLEGARGRLTAAQSKATLKGVEAGSP
jgi:cardiolipin synthase A/B